jgi:ubiquinone/menaquinone biosynthesis C-methylase UbiE
MPEESEARFDAEQMRQLYDRIGPGYDRLRSADAVPKRGALAMLDVQAGERVLEVGAGTGAVLLELAHAATSGALVFDDTPLRACGLDLSPVMVSLARERIAAAGLSGVVEVREGDARALPYDDASFDAAYGSYVLDLLPRADIPRALSELRRVLRPGGRLVLVARSPGTGVAGWFFTTAYTALDRLRPDRLGDGRPVRLVPLLGEAGFAVRERRTWLRGRPSEAVLAERPLPPTRRAPF